MKFSNLLGLKLKLYVAAAVLIVAAFFIVVVTILGIFISLDDNSVEGSQLDSCGQLNQVKEEVLGFRSIVEDQLNKQGITLEYSNCLMAQMMQESGGNPPDVFQASESKYGEVGKITTAEESIEQGVKRWSEIKNLIEEELGLAFNIDLLLQTYNFGSGYAKWLAQTNQEHTTDTAYSYSIRMTNKLDRPDLYKCRTPEQNGVACYGDFMYVEHVKKYLLDDGTILDPDDPLTGDFQLPFVNIPFVTTTDYKVVDGKQHEGLDLVAYNGAPISAIADGKVISSFADGEVTGYGNMITIQHDNGLFSRYAHLERRMITSVGTEVKQGQVIGTQGNTGRSTGSHLHFEIRKKNDYAAGNSINPRKYLPFPKER